MSIITFENMESGENSVQNLMDESSNHLTNNNTIELNCSLAAVTTTATDDALANITIKGDGFDDSTESQSITDIQKPNVFGLIGGNENCDTETSDCNTKTSLNNNDLAIGFVDDDDETNGEIDGANLNQLQSDEAAQGHANNIG